MVEVNSNFPFVHRRKAIEIGYGDGYKRESDKGSVVTTYSWSDRIPHPTNMSNYDNWANDPEANIAFNVLTDIIAGVRYYTEMPEKDEKGKDIDPEHQHKQIADEYGERVNLDEDLQEIVMTMLQKGFCPVQRLKDYDLHILLPETFYIWRTKTGTVYRYTQEITQGNIISAWQNPDWQSTLNECKEAYNSKEFKELYEYNVPEDTVKGTLDDIILFFHRRTTSWPYGKSLVEPIGNLLDERTKMNEDMPKAIHRWAYPIPFVKTRGSKDALENACTNRAMDDWVFIGNVEKDEVSVEPLAIDPQARFIPYIELIYYQICEGLHAPLLLYLKNATEASATVMMESVDRLVNGIQSYVKRRVERFLFEPQTGKPVPRLIWGQPKTGLEEVSLTDVASVMPYLANNQKLDLLKQFGIELPEAEVEHQPQPQLPFQPYQKPPMQVPTEQMLEKLNDMSTALQIIETNYQEKRILLTQAMRMGGKAIEVHLRRVHGKDVVRFEEEREVAFQKWVERLLGIKKTDARTFEVSVRD